MKVKKFNEMEKLNEFHHENTHSKAIHEMIMTRVGNQETGFDLINNLTYEINQYIKNNIDVICAETKNKN